MKNPIDIFLGWLARKLEEKKREVTCKVELSKETRQEPVQKLTQKATKEKAITSEQKKQDKKQPKRQEEDEIVVKALRRKKQKEGEIIPLAIDHRDIRDIMALMEVPFLALSKNRTSPIVYKNSNGSVKVRVSGHPPYYVASIYDWDIVLYVSSKIQEVINSRSDIPPRTLIISRNELLRELHRDDGKKQKKDLEESLKRLQSTVIETTVWNEDYRYRGGFSFLDNWGYTDRKDVKEFHITLSQWLYDGICKKGALLKVRPEYFKITSGVKKFLYRTARKHVGTKNEAWEFSIENLYKKSGSEQEFKKFKYDLKKAVFDDDIPEYFTKWIEKDGKTYVCFTNKEKEITKMLTGDKESSEIL